MLKNYRIRPPFFEVGPKVYMWGERMLHLARALDRIAAKYDIDVILTPQYTDIAAIAVNTERLHIYAQHMDPVRPGRGLGAVLPEAVKEAGAVGVMLNHAERKLDMEILAATMARADEVGLATIVCADTLEEVKAIAALGPNLMVARANRTHRHRCGQRHGLRKGHDCRRPRDQSRYHGAAGRGYLNLAGCLQRHRGWGSGNRLHQRHYGRRRPRGRRRGNAGSLAPRMG